MHVEFFPRCFIKVICDDGASAIRHIAPAPQVVLVDDLEEVSGRTPRQGNPDRLRENFVKGFTNSMGIVDAMRACTG